MCIRDRHDDGPGTGFSIGDDEFEVYSGFAPLLKMCIRDRPSGSAAGGKRRHPADADRSSGDPAYPAVSYTHLDVYKRQHLLCFWLLE